MAASIIETVEFLTISITGIVISGTATMTKSQTDTQCVPFATMRSTRDTNERFDMRWMKIGIAGSTVTATRGIASAPDVILSIFVVEFSTECTVEQETVSNSGATVNDSPSSNFTDITKTFLIVTWRITNATVDDWNMAMVRGVITSTSNVTFTRGATDGEMDMIWYSVECDGTQYSVQRGQFTLAAAVEIATDTITTTVDLTRSMLLATYSTSETADDARDGSTTATMTDGDTVQARRSRAASSVTAVNTIEWEVVEFATGQGVAAQKGSFVISPSVSVTDTDTITEVDADFAVVYSPMALGQGENASVNGDDIGVTRCSMVFNSTTEVEGEVVTIAGATTTFEWWVLDFNAGAPPVSRTTFQSLYPNTGTMIAIGTAIVTGLANLKNWLLG